MVPPFFSVFSINECTPGKLLFEFWATGGKTKKSRQPEQRVCIQIQYYCKDLFETQGYRLYARVESHPQEHSTGRGKRDKKFNKERERERKTTFQVLCVSLFLFWQHHAARERLLYIGDMPIWLLSALEFFIIAAWRLCLLASLCFLSAWILPCDVWWRSIYKA